MGEHKDHGGKETHWKGVRFFVMVEVALGALRYQAKVFNWIDQ